MRPTFIHNWAEVTAHQTQEKRKTVWVVTNRHGDTRTMDDKEFRATYRSSNPEAAAALGETG